MRENLKHMKIYASPKPGIINLANNENFYSPWISEILDELQQTMNDLPIHEYGPDIHHNLVNAYAKYASVKKEQILAAPGSDSIIPLLVQAITTKKIITLKQDFFRYAQAAEITSRENIKIDFGDNMYDEIIKQANANDVELIILSNPNNPLGFVHKEENLLKILDNVKCHVVIDEAYWEFCNQTIIEYLDKYPKLIILRTLSKAWGMAGLRIGFAIANPDLINYLLAVQGPFTISTLVSRVASKALENVEMMKKSIEKILEQKKRLIEYFNKYPEINIYDSGSNFIYIEIDNAEIIKNQILENGILVGYFPTNGLRITIGSKKEMDMLINILDKILKENK